MSLVRFQHATGEKWKDPLGTGVQKWLNPTPFGECGASKTPKVALACQEDGGCSLAGASEAASLARIQMASRPGVKRESPLSKKGSHGPYHPRWWTSREPYEWSRGIIR